jgi:hypothetical protein
MMKMSPDFAIRNVQSTSNSLFDSPCNTKRMSWRSRSVSVVKLRSLGAFARQKLPDRI